MVEKIKSNMDFYAFMMRMQDSRATSEDSLEIPTKLNTVLSYYPAIILLNIYPSDLKCMFT